MSSDKQAHWYGADGTAQHEQPKADGKGTTPTTLRHARKLGLYPSVTTILGILDKPQLTDWKLEQVGGAAWDVMMTGEVGKPYTRDDFTAMVIQKGLQQTTDAADLGTRIHKAIEQFMQGLPHDPELDVYVRAVEKWTHENLVQYIGHEERVVHNGIGYAGTMDAPITFGTLREKAVLDFKSRKTIPGKAVNCYDGQAMQIAAYRAAYAWQNHTDYRAASGVNLFISTTEPGRIEAVWHQPATLDAEFEAFKHLAAVWQHLKGYRPPVT